MQTAAIGQRKNAFGRNELQRLAQTLGNDVRGLDLVCFDVDNTYADFKLVRKLLEQLEIFSAAAREFEGNLLNVCLENSREQIFVIPRPGRFAIPVAIADVECNL